MCDICKKDDDGTVIIDCLGFDCGNRICLACSVANEVDLCTVCRPIQLAAAQATRAPIPLRPIHHRTGYNYCCIQSIGTIYDGACPHCKTVNCGRCSKVRSDYNYCCDLHAFYCKNCASQQHSVRSACTIGRCMSTNVCNRINCGKFGNALFVCNNHSGACFFCSNVAPLVKTGADVRMYCLYRSKFGNTFKCCQDDLLILTYLVDFLRQHVLDFNIIGKILHYCYRESSCFDHRNKTYPYN
jgi:hypothetical protein